MACSISHCWAFATLSKSCEATKVLEDMQNASMFIHFESLKPSPSDEPKVAAEGDAELQDRLLRSANTSSDTYMYMRAFNVLLLEI